MQSSPRQNDQRVPPAAIAIFVQDDHGAGAEPSGVARVARDQIACRRLRCRDRAEDELLLLRPKPLGRHQWGSKARSASH
jgi:hypothetical protein